jgi:hypothetical protein
VRDLWRRCVPVTADPEVAAWLAERTDPGPIDPAKVAALDLARALPADLVDLPGWARFKGKPWTASGHRLVVRAWEADPDNPERLRVASLHARNVLPNCAGDDKAAWPAGATAASLILATGPDPRAHGLPLVEIPEGVPDWLRLAVTVAADLPKGKRSAVWGAWSGSADPAVAAVVPVAGAGADGTGVSGRPPLPWVGCDACAPGMSVGVGAAVRVLPPMTASDTAKVTAMARDFRINGSCSLTGRRALGVGTPEGPSGTRQRP